MSIPRLLTYGFRVDDLLQHLYYKLSFLIACRYIMMIDHGAFRVLYYEVYYIIARDYNYAYKNTNALIREQCAVNLDT